MNFKHFDEFLKLGVVKKQSPNRNRALSIVDEVEGKKKYLELSLKLIPDNQMSSNFVVDSCYDIIVELLRAKMLIDGYNPGNSHEAEISYLEKLSFVEADIRFANELRYFRNGTKYYGVILTRAYASKVLVFMNRIYPILISFLEVSHE